MNDNSQHNANAQLTAVRVSGSDCREFLQGQLTQDLDRLGPDQPLLAGWNSAKGRLFFVSWLADWQDSVWFVVPGELADPIVRRLGMFVLRADVRVEKSTLPVYPIDDESTQEGNASRCFNDGNSLTLLSAGGGWQIGGEATGPATAATLADWRLQHIRAGRPLIWPQTSEDFVPQMVNLDLLGGISFSKGCYVGQEIVARTQNLGRIKRRMYRFATATGPVPLPGDVIKSGSHGAGKIVDAVAAPDGGIELLAVIRIESLRDELSLDDGRALQHHSLPYSVPETVD